jgi:hypothetical protein
MAEEKQKDSKPQKQDYEEIGKAIVNFYENGYFGRRRTLKMSFLKGMAGGVGGVIGATLVIAIFIWVLSLLKSVPLVGPFFENVRNTINQTQE